MKDIHSGDFVFDEKGTPTRVVATTDVLSEDSYEVVFGKNKTSIVCDKNHKWVTGTKYSIERFEDGKITEDEAFTVKTTKEISQTLKNSTSNQSNHYIRKAQPLQYPEKELPIDPYILGLWEGDGHNSGEDYTTADPEILESIREAGYTVVKSTNNTYIYRINGLYKQLRELGLLNNKHIPELYKTASFEQRLALCQGLMDSDGSVENGKRVGSCCITSSDHPLAEDIFELLVGLGLKPNMYTRETWLNGERKKDRSVIKFKTVLPVFRLPRKLERIQSSISTMNDGWNITDVRQIESRPMKCIQVESKSHQFLAGRHLIPTHNSFLARNAAVIYAINVPGIQIYIFRRTFSEVKGNFLYGDAGLATVLAEAERAGVCSINSAEPRIHFANGSDIYLRHMQTPSDVEQIRGRDVHVLICDEATQWMIRDIYNQLRTCMRCALEIDYQDLEAKGLDFIKPNYFPRAYILSNPGGIAHGFIKAEFIDSLEPNIPKQMPPERGGMLRQFIPAFLEDNTALMKLDPNYRHKLLGSGKHVRAMLEGDWSIPDGSALADEWSHVYNEITPFEIPKNARIKRCFDWGLSKPFAVTYVWETMNEPIKLYGGADHTFPSGTIIVVGEYYGWNGEPDTGCRKTAKQVGAAIKQYEMSQSWGSQIVPGPADGSIFNGTSTDKTVNDDIVWGYNSHSLDSVQYSKVKKESLFIPADKSKGSRSKGLVLVKSYLEGAHWIEDGDMRYPPEKPGLIFFKTCKQCIRTLPFVPYDLNNPDDVDTGSEDHLYDTIRYAVLGHTTQFKRLNIQGI